MCTRDNGDGAERADLRKSHRGVFNHTGFQQSSGRVAIISARAHLGRTLLLATERRRTPHRERAAGRTIRVPWLGFVVLLGALLNPSPVRAAEDQSCTQDDVIAFAPIFQALADRLGPTMGDPQEFGRRDPGSGDTLQSTTSGLAYVRPRANAPAFTNGWQHWALVDEGLVAWAGPSSDPPDAGAAGVGPDWPQVQAAVPAGMLRASRSSGQRPLTRLTRASGAHRRRTNRSAAPPDA
jgi:hypothetical protein